MDSLYRVLFIVSLAAVIFVAIAKPEPRRFDEWDAPLYLSVAYGIKQFGVFSNGRLATKDGEIVSAEPGMFISPLYPTLLSILMSVNDRIDAAITCAVRSIHGFGNIDACARYTRPVLILNTMLAIIGVISVGIAAERMVPVPLIFYVVSGIATWGAIQLKDFFSQITIEPLLFCLFPITMLAFVEALQRERPFFDVLSGSFAGLLTLAKPSFFVLLIFLPVAYIAHHWITGRKFRILNAALILLGFLLLVGPWLIRNQISVGTLSLSSEYGSAAVVERFAYNKMSPLEWGLSFAYCIPRIGPKAVHSFARDEMRRFDSQNPNGFFQTGYAERRRLIQDHGGIDKVIWPIVWQEMYVNWLPYALTTIALGWCGLWVGGTWSLVFFPLFITGLIGMRRDSAALVLSYTLPALLLVGVHAAVMSGASRYNLGLIGPLSIGSGWLLAAAWQRMNLGWLTKRASNRE